MKESLNNSDTLGDGTLDAFELDSIYVCLHVRIYIFVLYVSICTYIHIYIHICTSYVCGPKYEGEFQ